MIAAQAASAQVYDQGFKYLFGMYTPNDTVTRPLIDLLIAKNPSMKRVAAPTLSSGGSEAERATHHSAPRSSPGSRRRADRTRA